MRRAITTKPIKQHFVQVFIAEGILQTILQSLWYELSDIKGARDEIRSWNNDGAPEEPLVLIPLGEDLEVGMIDIGVPCWAVARR